MQSLKPASPRPHVSFRALSVTKLFGETVALWGVDLAVRSGEVIAIRGANGSGKTTLLRVVAGLLMPSSGRVAWTMTSAASGPRIGLLGHSTQLFDELTAAENVRLAARLARRDEADAVNILDSLGVAHYSGRWVGTLSVGIRRRVGLARVLGTDPDVLLVDEPFAGLDETAADLVAGALSQAGQGGRVVVIASHDLTRSRQIATSLFRLERGRIRSDDALSRGAMSG